MLLTLAVILVLFLLALLAAQLVTSLVSLGDTKLSINDRATLTTALATVITGIVAVLGVSAAVIAGLYARAQFRTTKKSAQWDFVLRFDERFRAPEHLHIYESLLDGGPWAPKNGSGQCAGPSDTQEMSDVRRYMRLFERLQFCIENGIVETQVIAQAYGYRLRLITRNTKICDEVFAHITEEPWVNFMKLWEKIAKVDFKEREKEYQQRHPIP